MTIPKLKWSQLGVTFAFIISVVAAQFSMISLAHAAGSTVTWNGSAGDNKFSTAANWVGSTAPVNGDSLVFPVGILSGNATLNNDISSLALAGITISGTASAYSTYIINGNTITLAGNIVNSAKLASDNSPIDSVINTGLIMGMNVLVSGGVSFGGSGKTIDTAGYYLTITRPGTGCSVAMSTLVGSGSVILTAAAGSIFLFSSPSPSYTGAISISAGSIYANNTGAFGGTSGITLSGSASLSLYSAANSTWNVPITAGGTGSISAQHSGYNGCSGGTDTEKYTATLSGPLTLTSNFLYNGDDNLTVSGTYTDNGHAFTVKSGSAGTLTLPSGAVQAPEVVNTYSDDQSGTNVTAGYRETVIIDGVRGYVQVNAGGTLKGTGTVTNLSDSGTLAPGHSPGKLTVLNSYTEAGTYQAELLNKDTYDQLIVGKNYSGGGNAVSLYSGAILSPILYDGWSIKQGDKFTIIDNLSATAVSGTFTGMAEGSQFVVKDGAVSITFSISYVGGDGNDVVLTALNTGSDPTPPNTGAMHIITANPIVLAGLGIITAGILIFAATRRRNTN